MPKVADVLEFLPLFPTETEEGILARLRGWANESLDPGVDVEAWVDTREGSFWYIAVMPAVREFARLYDALGTDVPASAFPLWAWGDYLDDHAEVRDLLRLAATSSTGEVTFSGTDGTFVPAGTLVAVEPPSETADAPEYQTTEGGTIAAGEVVLPVRALDPGEQGDVAAAAVTILVTPIDGVTSVENAEEIRGGTDPETDEELRERLLGDYRGRGSGNVADYVAWARAYEGVGRAAIVALGKGPGTVVVIVSTADGSPVSNETLVGLQNYLDPPVYVGELTAESILPDATIDVVSTEGARDEGILRLGDQAVLYTGKTATTFTGCSGGTGTFAIGSAITQSGRARGRAPVGHHVFVLTASTFAVAIAATVEPEDGYTLDGTGGTVALRAAIITALRLYVESIEPGGEIVIAQVIARIASIAGVHDVSDVEVNASTTNVDVPAEPPQVPALDDGDVTLV